jgi:PST family polysaccharide transporter
MRIAAVEIAANIAGIAVGVVSAWQGLGPWAIVLMVLTIELFTTLGAWMLCTWRPGFHLRGMGIGSLLAFGGNLTGFNIINYFARNLDDVLVGRVWGEQALGFYQKAYQLLLMPLQQVREPVAGVAIPTLSRLQGNPERYRHYYCQAVRFIAFLTMPLVTLLGVLSIEAVTLLGGEQWRETGVIFALLSPAAFFQPVVSTVGWVYVSLDQTRRMRNWGVVFAVILTLGVIAGLPWGARGVAAAYTGIFLILMYPTMVIAYRFSPVSVAAVLGAVRRPMIASLAGAALVFGVRSVVEGFPAWTVVGACVGADALFWGMVMLLWRRLREDAMEFIHVVRSARGRSESESDA